MTCRPKGVTFAVDYRGGQHRQAMLYPQCPYEQEMKRYFDTAVWGPTDSSTANPTQPTE